MSKVNAKGQLSGAAGPVYFRVLNGKGILQSKPRTHKKAPEATDNANEFGLASKTSKSIRTMLYPILQDRNDTMMYRRFVAVIHSIIKSNNALPKGKRSLLDGNLTLLAGFEFNEASLFANYCSVMPTITQGGQELNITFPEFSNNAIKAPSQASDTIIGIRVTVLDPITQTEHHAEDFRIDVPNREGVTPATTFSTTTLPQGQLILVTAALFFYRESSLSGRITLNSKELHPCRVLSSRLAN